MVKIILPPGIDYSKYTSNSGMSTKHWGPAAWSFLFTSIMGSYPTRIDETNINDMNIKTAFKDMLTNMSFIMPCIFCKNSFKTFIEELPIDDYLIGRIELMYWLYLMKDKVNKKLIYQENQCYNDEKKKLKTLFYLGKISEKEYYNQINIFKNDTCCTIITPPFNEILEKYENIRASCSEKAKKCTIKKEKGPSQFVQIAKQYLKS